MNNKFETVSRYPLFSIIWRIFADPLIAMLIANWLGNSTNSLMWLSQFTYLQWLAICMLIQVMWGTDRQSGLVIQPLKTFKERILE